MSKNGNVSSKRDKWVERYYQDDEDWGKRDRGPWPPWLLGLIIAVVIFGVGLLVFQALGFGDDPVIGATEALARLTAG